MAWPSRESAIWNEQEIDRLACLPPTERLHELVHTWHLWSKDGTRDAEEQIEERMFLFHLDRHAEEMLRRPAAAAA